MCWAISKTNKKFSASSFIKLPTVDLLFFLASFMKHKTVVLGIGLLAHLPFGSPPLCSGGVPTCECTHVEWLGLCVLSVHVTLTSEKSFDLWLEGASAPSICKVCCFPWIVQFLAFPFTSFFISSFYFAFLRSWTPRPFCKGLRPSRSPTGAGAQ